MTGKQERKPSASSVELTAVTEKHLNAKYIDVLVNRLAVLFKVNSGAEVSVVPSSFPSVPSRLQQPGEELKGLDNHTTSVLGTFSEALPCKGRLPNSCCMFSPPRQFCCFILQLLKLWASASSWMSYPKNKKPSAVCILISYFSGGLGRYQRSIPVGVNQTPRRFH
ncbi:hypothetical protein MRX96_049072 [Rhipicephalus microplus]